MAIFIVTDGPIGLRPTIGHPNAERFLALSALGLFFSLAYPRSAALVAVLLATAVCLFEFLQHFVHYRHGTVHDVVIKLAGVGIGSGIGKLISTMMSKPRQGANVSNRAEGRR